MASENGHLEVVQALLAKGADVNAKANDGETALMLVASQTAASMWCRRCSTRGPRSMPRRTMAATALMWPAANGHLEVVQALLAKGADVNAKENDGRTALMMASQNGHLEVVQALLAKGAEVNAKDEQWLDRADDGLQNGHLEVVQALLAKGAEVNAKMTTMAGLR